MLDYQGELDIIASLEDRIFNKVIAYQEKMCKKIRLSIKSGGIDFYQIDSIKRQIDKLGLMPHIIANKQIEEFKKYMEEYPKLNYGQARKKVATMVNDLNIEEY